MTGTVRRFLTSVLAILFLATAGCPSSSEQTRPSDGSSRSGGVEPAEAVEAAEGSAASGEKLLILCGNSFLFPTEKLAADFSEATGIEVEISSAGSEDHLPHVKLQAQGDIFISHDPFMGDTEKAGSMLRWIEVGSQMPALVVPKGNLKKIAKIEDLGQKGLRVILPNPEFSTCGEMVFALLEKKGIKEAVVANVGGAMQRSHGDIGTSMKLGHGDAAIMWNSVAYNFRDAVEIIALSDEFDEEIRVGVIGLNYSKQPEKVEKFLEFVDTHGKEVFESFGYVK